MSRKRAAFIAAIAAGAVGAAMALPASATHPPQGVPPEAGGYAQTVGAALSLPPIGVKTGVDDTLVVCIPTRGCTPQPIKAEVDVNNNDVRNIELGLSYVLLQNTTHLPVVTTAAGTEGFTCPVGTVKAGEKVPGISLNVAGGASDRFSEVNLSLKFNGTEMGPWNVENDSSNTQQSVTGHSELPFGVGLCGATPNTPDLIP